MKRCPACRRDYHDDSLLYCLDDGSALLDGPAASSDEEPATVSLSNNSPSDGTATSFEGGQVRKPHPSKRSSMIAGAVGLILVTVLGVGSYLYYSPADPKRIDTIAVMPFVNDSNNPDLEYLSDGLTDTLIGSLGQLPELNVKSRTSVFRYKGRENDVREIGRELGVPAVLNGRLVQRGEDITLFLELVDTATENSLWQNTYSRKLSGLVELQSEIARDVARKLGAHLSGAEESRLSRNYAANPEAYQLYMRGRFHTLRVTRSELFKAVPFFQRAIELDPNYALAYTGLADAYRGLALGGELDPQEHFPKAKAAAQKAVEIDDELAEAHALLGWIIYWYDWDWELAEMHCRRAIALDPEGGDVHMALAHILSSTGRHDEAISTARRGREVDPLNIRNSTLEAQVLIYAGRQQEAIERLETVLQLEPNYWFAYQFLASAYIDVGRNAEAISAGEKGHSIYAENTRTLTFIAYAAARSGNEGRARTVLAEMIANSAREFVPPYNIAMLNLALGERAEAIKWLERGLVARDPRMVFVYCEPKFAELRNDPQFQNLLRRMKFIK